MMTDAHNSNIVAVHRPAIHPAPFACVPIVVETVRDDGGRSLEIRGLDTYRAPTRESLMQEDYTGLVDSGEFTVLLDRVPDHPEAIAYLLRANFPRRDAARDQLARYAIPHGECQEIDGTYVFLVDRVRADEWRRSCGDSFHDSARAAAERGDWKRVVLPAQVAYLLYGLWDARYPAFYALALEKTGRRTDADGVRSLANQSSRASYRRGCRDWFESFKQEYATENLVARPPPPLRVPVTHAATPSLPPQADDREAEHSITAYERLVMIWS